MAIMLIGVWKNLRIVRIGSDIYEKAILQEYVTDFDITGKPINGWGTVEPEGSGDNRQLRG